MIPLSSHLHCFQWDICFIPYLYSSANNMSFIHLIALKIFSLSLVLKTFIVICLGIIFSMFLVLEVFWDSWIYGFKVVTKYGGKSHHYFFKCISEHILLILGTPITHVTGNLKLSHRSLIICLSFLHYSFFSVYFFLSNLYFYVIKLASPFFCNVEFSITTV